MPSGPRATAAAADLSSTGAEPMPRSRAVGADRLPVRMLHDRVLVSVENEQGERRSGGGILIPATASVGTRLSWAVVVAVGPTVRQIEVGDRVLYDPADRAEVEIQGTAYVLLRERDIHAVAAARVSENHTGLYL